MSDHTTNEPTNEIPYGYCHCGCGQLAPISQYTAFKRGYIKGQPVRFIAGHHNRLRHPRPIEDRFWEKVDKRDPDECWEWTAAKGTRGYGELANKPNPPIAAHRLSYIIAHGSIPEGMDVCHSCDNPACCNPAHLWLGTHRDNMHDMYLKNRRKAISGEQHRDAKFTNEQIRHIREMYKSGQYRLCELTRMFDISRTSMTKILKGLTYKNID